jgi:hypothetical protein
MDRILSLSEFDLSARMPVKCPELAQSGHSIRAEQCPLLGVKRTSEIEAAMSAYDPKQTLPPPPHVQF